jgi:hypothetical protein
MAPDIHPPEDAMPGPKAIDPNLVTADALVRGSSEPEPVEAAPGQVLKRGAPPPPASPGKPGESLVRVRITKAGDGKVHTGAGPNEADPEFYAWNDEVALPRSIGEALEDRHYAEII